MPEKSTTFQDPADAPGVSETISQVASQVNDKVSDLGQAAVNKMEEHRDSAARGLESAASTLHEKAESIPGGENVTSLAHSAAEKLSSTAD